MKRITLSLLALAISFSIAQAQETTSPPAKTQGKQFHGYHGKPGMKHHGEAMYYAKLNLTADQQQQMKSINEATRSKMSDLRKQEATITVKAYKEQMKAIGKEKHEKIQAVLTPDQKQQLAKMRADRGKKFDGMAKNRMEKMKKDLQLTDDQSAKIQALGTATRSKIKSIREDQSLSADQKKEQVMAAFKKQHEDMNSLLTPDQIKKMEAMRAKHMHRDAR
jgi:Spy/CpxP family protein refolding chaperone